MPIYSHSRLSVFEQCPRKYYYQYVAKIPVEEEEGIEAFLGILVHEALERLYRDALNGKRQTADELVAGFEAAWQKRFHDGIVIVRKNYTADNYHNVGVQALRDYYTHYGPFDQTRTLALEERVSIQLDPEGQYRLQGYIDRLAKTDDGILEIHDYKTNSRLPTQAEKDEDRQLALYQLGVEGRWTNIAGVELVWHFLRFDQEIRSKWNREELDELRRETIALIDNIEGRAKDEAAFEPHESKLCDWCSFQHVCPIRKHLFKVENLPPNEFLTEPGVKLVNRWASVRDQIKKHKDAIADLDEQEQRIIEAIIALAARENLCVIVGSDRAVAVETKTKFSLPTKSERPDEYTDLEQRLRKSRNWAEISAMDVHRLRRIWLKEEDDPGRIRKILEPFVQDAQVNEARLRKLKE